MAGASKTTTDHEVIRQWAEERGATPSTVEPTGGKEDPGLLRFNFPGYSGRRSLVDISWDEFFRKFDEKQLVFLYQDTTRTGKQSRFCKFISQETAAKNEDERGRAADRKAEAQRHNGHEAGHDGEHRQAAHDDHDGKGPRAHAGHEAQHSHGHDADAHGSERHAAARQRGSDGDEHDDKSARSHDASESAEHRGNGKDAHEAKASRAHNGHSSEDATAEHHANGKSEHDKQQARAHDGHAREHAAARK